MKFFVKFGENHHLNRSYVYNKFYFGSAKQYIDIEEKEKIKGQGDSGEATLKLNGSFRTLIGNSNQIFIKYNLLNANVVIEAASRMPTYCISEIDTDTHCYKTSKGYKIKPEFISLIKKHFPKADSALIIKDKNEFIQAFKNNFPLGKYGKIKYLDILPQGITTDMAECFADEVSEFVFYNRAKKNIVYFTEKFNDGTIKYYIINNENAYKILFIKSPFFKEECEFRFVLPNKALYKPGREYLFRGLNQKNMELHSLENLSSKFIVI